MLTFELAPEDDTVIVSGDAEGLRRLVGIVEALVAKTKDGQFEHEHLMTPQWGGDDLDAEAQWDSTTLVNHVKVYCIKGNICAT